MDIKVAQEHSFEVSDLSHGEYKYSRILKQSGGRTETISSANVESRFIIPSNCINLSESILKFTSSITIPNTRATVSFAYRDVLPIQRIQLNTIDGVALCDLSFVGHYCKASARMETSNQSLFSSGTDSGNLMTPASSGGSANNNKYPNNAGFESSNEPLVLQSAANAAANVINWSVKLGDALPNTIFALNKSMVFGRELVLQITWGDRNDWGYEATAVTNPSTGAVNLAADVAMTNLGLYVATETDQRIINTLVNKMRSDGLSIPIDYVHSYRNSQDAGDATVDVRLSPAHGVTLTKVFHVISAGDGKNERYNTRFFDNGLAGVNNVKDADSFYTLVNDLRRQDYNMDLASGEDYDYLKPYLKGSCVSKRSTFQEAWSWVDDFAGKLRNPSNSGVVVGLQIPSSGVSWGIYVQNQQGRRSHYSYACCQKVLSIKGNMIQLR